MVQTFKSIWCIKNKGKKISLPPLTSDLRVPSCVNPSYQLLGILSELFCAHTGKSIPIFVLFFTQMVYTLLYTILFWGWKYKDGENNNTRPNIFWFSSWWTDLFSSGFAHSLLCRGCQTSILRCWGAKQGDIGHFSLPVSQAVGYLACLSCFWHIPWAPHFLPYGAKQWSIVHT
jgi:hypothetical protein